MLVLKDKREKLVLQDQMVVQVQKVKREKLVLQDQMVVLVLKDKKVKLVLVVQVIKVRKEKQVEVQDHLQERLQMLLHHQ